MLQNGFYFRDATQRYFIADQNQFTVFLIEKRNIDHET